MEVGEGEEFVFPRREGRGGDVAKEESKGRSVGGTKRGGATWTKLEYRGRGRGRRELYPGARHKSLWTDSMFD